MKWLFRGILFSFLLVSLVHAGETRKAAVFISDAIQPYHEAAQGIESVLKQEAVDMILVDINDLTPEEFKNTCKDLLTQGYTYWIGIGPAAVQEVYRYDDPGVAARVFCMVLDPDKTIHQADTGLCGVSLKIPVEQQVSQIVHTFSKDIQPGIIYDPAHNAIFAERAGKEFEKKGITLKHLQVSTRSDVPGIFENGIKHINLLWMIPDPTVITESLIRYIIKDAIKQGVGVVGYNRFFLKQGAAAAFVIDYAVVGQQAASLLLDEMTLSACRVDPPVFEFNTNTEMMRMLELAPPHQDVSGGALHDQ